MILASLGWALWGLSTVGVMYWLMLAGFFDRKATYEEVWLRQRYRYYIDYEKRVKKFIPRLY